MFVRVKSTPLSPRKSVQIVASVREGSKIDQQKILRHVGVADDAVELTRLQELTEVLVAQLRDEEAGGKQMVMARLAAPLSKRGSVLWHRWG